MAWYDNVDTRGYNNMLGTQAWPEYNPNLFSNTGVGRFDPRNLMRPDNLTQDLGASTYQAPPPSQLNTLDPNWQHQIRMQEIDRGNIDRGFLDNITGPVKGGLKWLGDKFRRPEAKQRFYEEIMQGRSIEPWQTGMYKGNQYGLYNSPSGLKVSSDVIGWGEGYEKNLDSMFGSKSIEEMEQKKIDWAMNRLQKGKAISQRLRDVLTARGLIGGNIGDQRPGKDPTIPIGPIDTGGQPIRPAYTGPRTYDFDPGAHRRAGGNRPDKPGGFTDPGKGSYGPHRAEGGRMAYGGRAGYQEGELVEDESMFAATPQGMMEENIEEVQGEPTREQLEAIALEIFRLPLEQLNEEQLNVVYQAAMEQEPAEEEVQFAAQEGPGQGIASLV
jgi:hypothetical protein